MKLKNFLGRLFYLLPIALIVYYVWNLLSFGQDKLTAWFDYPYMIWVLFQNINKIVSLDFSNYFDTNIYFPFSKNTLLFSDLLIPQSILALPIYLITKNRIDTFNILIFVVLVLNYFSLLLFAKSFLQKNISRVAFAVLFLFSTYTTGNLGNFQMVCYFPFFFGAYFLNQLINSGKKMDFSLSIFFCLMQFLASVYLSVFMLVYFSLFFIFYRKIKLGVLFFLAYFVAISFFVFKYMETKKYME